MPASQLRIQRVVLKNYRKYLGEQSVELSTDSKKPVTVIHGISGKGKTTFLNALHWCIYGEERNNLKIQKESDEGLIHSSIIDNLKIDDNEEMYVEILMEDDEGPTYRIKRSIIIKKKSEGPGKKFSDEIDCQISKGIDVESSVEFSSRNEDTGEMESDTDPGLIEYKIEKVFPKILSSYILFDAELLNTFQKDEQGSLVKEGMEKITGLPIVFEAKQNLEHLRSKIRRDSSGGNETYQKYLDKQKTIQGDKEGFEEKIKKCENEIKNNNSIIVECTKFLKEYDDEMIRKNEDLRASIVTNIDGIEEKLKNQILITHNTIFDNLYKFYIQKELVGTVRAFDEYAEKGLFPTVFTKEQINKVLSDERCLCGRPVTDNEKEIKDTLEHMLSKVFDLEECGELNKIRNRMIEHLDSIKGESKKEILQKFKKIQLDTEKYREELKIQKNRKKELDEKLAESKTAQTKIQEYGKRRTDSEKIVLRCEQDKAIASERLNSAQGHLKQTEHEIIKLEKIQIKDQVIKNRIALAELAINQFTQLKDESLDHFREQVQKSAQAYFLNTAPEADTFTGVEINDSFVIEAKTKDKTRKISQGQAHCLGLSYIAAVRDVTKHNYFMVIDSPFHNVSQESKLLICKELPTKMGVTQITFLVTETEYKAEIPAEGKDKALPSVKEILKQNNLIWKRYDIIKEDMNGIPYAKIIAGET